MTSGDVVGWTIKKFGATQPIMIDSTCYYGNFLGRFNEGYSIEKTFTNLPPHWSIQVSLNLAVVFKWDQENIYFYMDGTTIFDQYFEKDTLPQNVGYANTKQMCTNGGTGQKDNGAYMQTSFNITHTSNTMTFKIDSNTDEDKEKNTWWGIANFIVWVDQCHFSCLTCSGPAYNQCLTCPTNSEDYSAAYGLCRCRNGYIAYENACVLMSSCPANYIEDKYKKTCDQDCLIENCNTCLNQFYCNTCSAGFKNLYGECVENCPFYTTDDGTNCNDIVYDTFPNPKIGSQLFMQEQFTHAESYNTGFTTNVASYSVSGTYEWTNYAFYDCAGTSYAFGYQYANVDCNGGCTQSKTFNNLPPHYEIYVQVEIMSGDSWNPDDYSRVYLDGVQYDYYSRDYTGSPVCADVCGGFDEIGDCYNQLKLGPFSHTSSQLDFQIYFQADSNLYNEWIGFRELSVTVKACMEVCASCSDSTSCNSCIDTRTGANCDQPANGYYDDGSSSLYFPSCDSKCATCSGTSDSCVTCSDAQSAAPTCEQYDKCLHWVKIDSGNFDHGSYHKVYLNGIDQGYPSSLGIGLTVFDTNGEYVEFINYDTSTSFADVQALTTKLNGLTSGYYALIGVYEDGGYELDPYAYLALQSIGLDSNTVIDYRDGFAMIGKQGLGAGNGKQKLNKRGDTQNNAIVEGCLMECLSSCATCGTRYDNCLSCDSPLYLNDDTPTDNCVSTCPAGRYKQDTPSRICADCTTECATCTSTTVCQSCNAGYYLYNNFCYNPCPDGTYADTVNGICVDCDSACKTCNEATSADCIECNDSPQYYLMSSDNTCYSDCPGAFYEDNTTTPPSCQACDPKCTLCYEATSDDCTQCNTPTYELSGNSCVLNCDPECLTCKTTPTEDAAYCLSCDTPLYLLGTTCVADCGAGYYEEDSTRTCELCSSECATCTSLTVCQSCNNGYFLYNDFCQNPCPGTYYGDTSTNTCESCQPLCATCDESAPNDCTSCFSDRFLDGGQCKVCTDYLGYESSDHDPHVCQEICGDGIRVDSSTECDDGNTDNNDGCSQSCTIEQGWKCQGGDSSNPDICYSLIMIEFEVSTGDDDENYYNLYENKEYTFQLKFSQEFTLLYEQTLQDLINIKIEGHENIQNDVTIKQIDDVGILYQVVLVFGETVRERNLFVSFDHPEYFLNQYNNNLLDETKSLKVKQYFYYSDEQRAQTEEICKFVEFFIIWLFVYTLIFLAINKFWMVSNALDNMQLVFMIGFFNFRQPINGYFFNNKIQRLQDFYLPNIFSFESKYETKNKFDYYDYSGNFLVNVGSLIQIFVLLGIIHLILRIVMIQQLKSNQTDPNQKKMKYKTNQIVKKKDQQNSDKKTSFFYIKFCVFNLLEFRLWNDIIQACIGIIFFFSLINLLSFKFGASLFISCIFGIGILFIIFFYCKIIKNNKQQPYNVQELDKQQRDNLNFEQEMLNPSYKYRTIWHKLNLQKDGSINWIIVLLIKKLIQATIIVFLQGHVLAQIVLIMVQSLFYMLYILIKKPFLRQIDNYHILITELLVVIGVCVSIQMKNDISEDEYKRYNQNMIIIGVYLAALVIHNIHLSLNFLAIIIVFLQKRLCTDRLQVQNLQNQRNFIMSTNNQKEFDIAGHGTLATPSHSQRKLIPSPFQKTGYSSRNQTMNTTNFTNLPMNSRKATIVNPSSRKLQAYDSGIEDIGDQQTNFNSTSFKRKRTQRNKYFTKANFEQNLNVPKNQQFVGINNFVETTSQNNSPDKLNKQYIRNKVASHNNHNFIDNNNGSFGSNDNIMNQNLNFADSIDENNQANSVFNQTNLFTTQNTQTNLTQMNENHKGDFSQHRQKRNFRQNQIVNNHNQNNMPQNRTQYSQFKQRQNPQLTELDNDKNVNENTFGYNNLIHFSKSSFGSHEDDQYKDVNDVFSINSSKFITKHSREPSQRYLNEGKNRRNAQI